MTTDFVQYLLAKQTVDDRALNQRVWKTMMDYVNSRTGTFEVLELGTGIGTMLDRLHREGVWNENWRVTAVDLDPDNISTAKKRVNLPHVTFLCADIYEFLAQTNQQWDMIIAHAFLDLFDLPTLIPQLLNKLSPSGAFYFTINFDGETIFEPSHLHDAQILNAYHASMHGGQHLGRHLIPLVKKEGAKIKVAGSSDWLVYAQEGVYPHDEATFLHHILDFLEASVPASPEHLAWLTSRRRQIENGQLLYIAHQIDIFGTN